jgi:hypothetical protein
MPTDLLVRQAHSMVQMVKNWRDSLTSSSCSRLGRFCEWSPNTVDKILVQAGCKFSMSFKHPNLQPK